MNIFDYLNDIQTNKNRDLPVDEYIPYMVSRWVSFYSKDVATKINETVNVSNPNLEKEQHYALMCSIVPKTQRPKHLKYIKKTSNKSEVKDIDVLAYNMQLSKKEVEQLIELKKIHTK